VAIRIFRYMTSSRFERSGRPEADEAPGTTIYISL
jgi:hypothetical protein